jgi:hypothetical protein
MDAELQHEAGHAPQPDGDEHLLEHLEDGLVGVGRRNPVREQVADLGGDQAPAEVREGNELALPRVLFEVLPRHLGDSVQAVFGDPPHPAIASFLLPSRLQKG